MKFETKSQETSMFQGSDHSGHGWRTYLDVRGEMRCGGCHNIYKWQNVTPPEPARAPEKFTWTVAITLDKVWVEDGFILTPDRLQALIQSDLMTYSIEHEVKVMELASPSPAAIRLVQGYPPEEIDTHHPVYGHGRFESVYCATHGEVIPVDDHGIERCPICEKAASYSMEEARRYEKQDEPGDDS
jgi:hypothetical protein